MSSNPRQTGRGRGAEVDLLIAGASARAAAQSAARGGLHVAAADLFTDADLREIADATRIIDWPGGILDWTRKYPAEIPFLYTGGLENFPDLLDQISRQRPVAGVTGSSLRKLRDPGLLGRWCAARGFQVPRTARVGQALGKRLLVKPLRSVSGIGIHDFDRSPIAATEYLQEFIPGTPVSAAYLLTRGGAELLGTFRQLEPGPSETKSPRPFLYRGSITRGTAPIARLERLGNHLHDSGLRGPCGVDFIETGTGEWVLLEVNPRFTASMELWEQRTGRSLVGEYLVDIEGAAPPAAHPPSSETNGGTVRGKRIVFAPKPLAWQIPPPIVAPMLADIPPPQTRIPAGEPICTLFAAAGSFDECRRQLLVQEQRLLTHLEANQLSR